MLRISMFTISPDWITRTSQQGGDIPGKTFKTSHKPPPRARIAMSPVFQLEGIRGTVPTPREYFSSIRLVTVVNARFFSSTSAAFRAACLCSCLSRSVAAATRSFCSVSLNKDVICFLVPLTMLVSSFHCRSLDATRSAISSSISSSCGTMFGSIGHERCPSSSPAGALLGRAPTMSSSSPVGFSIGTFLLPFGDFCGGA
mmetsp:Transcript_33586/g.78508  ORF Transcript_33586/g.78508 Transcript_33586/m.78508 type:complete len:200 (+) Transcript_33586:1925-2524(+)